MQTIHLTDDQPISIRIGNRLVQLQVTEITLTNEGRTYRPEIVSILAPLLALGGLTMEDLTRRQRSMPFHAYQLVATYLLLTKLSLTYRTIARLMDRTYGSMIKRVQVTEANKDTCPHLKRIFKALADHENTHQI